MVLDDDRIVIAGDFNRINGVARSVVARLQPDGTLDGSFQSNLPLTRDYRILTVQQDGKILAGGGAGRGFYPGLLARAYENGSVDSSFVPAIDYSDWRLSPGDRVIVDDAVVLSNGDIVEW